MKSFSSSSSKVVLSNIIRSLPLILLFPVPNCSSVANTYSTSSFIWVWICSVVSFGPVIWKSGVVGIIGMSMYSDMALRYCPPNMFAVSLRVDMLSSLY